MRRNAPNPAATRPRSAIETYSTFGILVNRVRHACAGVCTLCVSAGSPQGTSEIALPLPNGRNRRYPLGEVSVTRSYVIG